MTTPSVDNKLDMLMEAILKQQELLKQVLLGFDNILRQVIVEKTKEDPKVWLPKEKSIIK